METYYQRNRERQLQLAKKRYDEKIRVKKSYYNFEGEKKCSQCKEVKSLNEFNQHPTTKDGFVGRCKDCCKEYYHRSKNREGECKLCHYDFDKENPHACGGKCRRCYNKEWYDKNIRKRLSDFDYQYEDIKKLRVDNIDKLQILIDDLRRLHFWCDTLMAYRIADQYDIWHKNSGKIDALTNIERKLYEMVKFLIKINKNNLTNMGNFRKTEVLL